MSAGIGGSLVSGLRCVRCGRAYRSGLDGPCPRCGPGGGLDVSYHLGRIRRLMTRRALAARPLTAWRYRELLPLPPTSRG